MKFDNVECSCQFLDNNKIRGDARGLAALANHFNFLRTVVRA